MAPMTDRNSQYPPPVLVQVAVALVRASIWVAWAAFRVDASLRRGWERVGSAVRRSVNAAPVVTSALQKSVRRIGRRSWRGLRVSMRVLEAGGKSLRRVSRYWWRDALRGAARAAERMRKLLRQARWAAGRTRQAVLRRQS